jgi:hypothetical protein
VNDLEQESIDDFFISVRAHIKNASDRERAIQVIEMWRAAWVGKNKSITATHSGHGSFLHFNLFLSNQWCHAFVFRSVPRQGMSLRGPDPDRMRRSHKMKANPLDRKPLDQLFEDWSQHPEGRPAGNAIEFFIDETPDSVWTACLQAVRVRLG